MKLSVYTLSGIVSANPNPPLPEFHVEASKLGCIQFIEVDAAGTI
jgi:hypothetical protein